MVIGRKLSGVVFFTLFIFSLGFNLGGFSYWDTQTYTSGNRALSSLGGDTFLVAALYRFQPTVFPIFFSFLIFFINYKIVAKLKVQYIILLLIWFDPFLVLATISASKEQLAILLMSISGYYFPRSFLLIAFIGLGVVWLKQTAVYFYLFFLMPFLKRWLRLISLMTLFFLSFMIFIKVEDLHWISSYFSANFSDLGRTNRQELEGPFSAILYWGLIGFIGAGPNDIFSEQWSVKYYSMFRFLLFTAFCIFVYRFQSLIFKGSQLRYSLIFGVFVFSVVIGTGLYWNVGTSLRMTTVAIYGLYFFFLIRIVLNRAVYK